MKRSLVTEPQGKRPTPAELVRERRDALEAVHGKCISSQHVGGGVVVRKFADGTRIEDVLPEGSRF